MQTRSRHVAILVFDEVNLLDVAGPLHVLSMAGRHWNWRPFVVHLAAAQAEVRTSTQAVLRATTTLSDCPPCEILLVPGGYGARALAAQPELLSWVGARGSAANLLACVAEGCLPLAVAGLLDEELVAAPIALQATLAEAPLRCRLSEKTTVFGPRVLSARSGTHGALLGLALVSRLLGNKLAASLGSQLDLPWSAGPTTPGTDIVIIDEPATAKPTSES